MRGYGTTAHGAKGSIAKGPSFGLLAVHKALLTHILPAAKQEVESEKDRVTGLPI
jgi:hypothetical protein